VRELLGRVLPAVHLLGLRTAQLHRALCSGPEDPAFVPEPYSSFDQRSIYQGKRNLSGKVLRQLRLDLPRLERSDPALAELARALLAMEKPLYKRWEPLLSRRLTAMRCRIHGDYRLESVLYTGKDFVVIDFEGDSARPLSERRRKRSALRDVATMLCSLSYAAFTALSDEAAVRAIDRAAAEALATQWAQWTQATFLGGWLATAALPLRPDDPGELLLMLDTLLLERSLDDVGANLVARPDLARTALRTLLSALS
jgi:maltose alpha-D-glucosyltransferase/alpha-amylase